jgi:hypothetical protein
LLISPFAMQRVEGSTYTVTAMGTNGGVALRRLERALSRIRYACEEQ